MALLVNFVRDADSLAAAESRPITPAETDIGSMADEWMNGAEDNRVLMFLVLSDTSAVHERPQAAKDFDASLCWGPGSDFEAITRLQFGMSASKAAGWIFEACSSVRLAPR